MAGDVPPRARTGTDAALVAVAGSFVLVGLLWLGGAISAVLRVGSFPAVGVSAPLAALLHPRTPGVGWGLPAEAARFYWSVTGAVVAAAAGVVLVACRLLGWPSGGSGGSGVASRTQVRSTTGERRLARRASALRPSLASARAAEVGWRIGRSRGTACWVSVEDSMLLLGPPRSGKGRSIVIPMILDAPGPVATTSTRPDNLAVTIAARSERGPVAVFDPQGLVEPACSVGGRLRWSPVRGCEWPRTAMLRAVALVGEGTGSVENGAFWRQLTVSAVRCLLHAAALDGRPPADLYRWSHMASGAKEAVAVLARHPAATPGWDRALDAIVSADPRARDSVWAMVANTFAPLADPAVLAAVTPAAGEEFDPAAFLTARGTLYLLGTSSGASATANLVAALVDDVVDVARRRAARSPGARLDPPLALLLDEAANYPLGDLPALMSEGGGSGIATLAVLQSLSQARDRWGDHAAGAIWDAATVKLVLGGSANADDLGAISRLLGERDVLERTETSGSGAASRSVSTHVQRRPVLDAAEIRSLPAGRGLLLLRQVPPILLDLEPWTARRDARRLEAARREFELASIGEDDGA